MKTTAFAMLAEELKLTPLERALMGSLLRATPVAITGQQTLAPISELLDVIGLPPIRSSLDRTRAMEKLRPLLLNLAHEMRTIELADKPDHQSWISFPLLAQVGWVEQARFVQYALSKPFLGCLKHLKEVHQLDLF